MVPSIVVLCGRRSNSRDPPPLPHAAPHVARLMIADRATPTIQYCPICLGRGATAHSRRGWRSALDVVCSIDGCFLRDSCWRCGGLLSPLLLTVPCRELLCVACGASLAKAPSLRMDATTSDQLMLDCGIAHRAVLLSSDVVSVRGKDSIGHARPAAFAGPIQPILPIATSRSCCKPRDGPCCRTRQEPTCLANQGARSRAEGGSDLHRGGVSGRRLAQLMAGDIRARAKGDRREWCRLVQCHHTLAGQLQTGEQRARHGRPSP